jgi:aspartate beta-hydroxylase
MGIFYDQAGRLIRGIYDSRIVGPPILAAELFPDGAKFAAAWRDIRGEALAVAGRLAQVPRFHEVMREQRAISDNDKRDWRIFILKAYGAEIARNMAACPILAGLVNAAPDVLSASFSFLAPGKHIPAHRGPFRGVLRYYLGLSMPRDAGGRPAAVLKIAGREHRVEEGESLLWDDTYPHEVWNASEEVRTVLLLDVWRPRMPLDMALLSHALVGLARVGVVLRGVP